MTAAGVSDRPGFETPAAGVNGALEIPAWAVAEVATWPGLDPDQLAAVRRALTVPEAELAPLARRPAGPR